MPLIEPPATSTTTGRRAHRSTGALVLALLLLLPQPVAPAIIMVGGACNLNAAITAANNDAASGGCPAGSGADRIELTADVALTAVDNITNGANGLPSVTSGITLDGNGYSVFRGYLAPPFRLFHVANDGDLDLEDIHLASGLASQPASGGAIYNDGTLALSNSTISGSTASGSTSAEGGAITNYGSALLDRSQILDCLAVANAAGNDSSRAKGGAIAHFFGSLTIRGSTLEGNLVYALGDLLATDRLARGGAVYSTADYYGNGAVATTGSTFSGNEARVELSGSVNRPEGAAVFAAGPSSITNSTISGNVACVYDGVGCSGGSIVDLPGVYSLPGGVVRHTTFHGNDAATTLEEGSVSGSLFAASTGDHCSGITDLGGGNLADDSTCAPTIAATLSGLDPTLTGNGGPTETHALQFGSTAIDIAGNCGLGTDQRGAGRMTPCDSGAYERLPCGLLQLDDLTVDAFANLSTCHTALLSPISTVTVTGAGDLRVTAGFLVNIANGFRAESGSWVEIGVDPSLLP